MYPTPPNPRRRSTPQLLYPLADVAPQPVHWLWPGRIPRGKVTLIAGQPGVGKSTVAAHLAAITSNPCLSWPDCLDHESPHSPPPRLPTLVPQPTDPQHVTTAPSTKPAPQVFLLASEDRPADTIRPRIDALGGRPENILVATRGIPLTDPSYVDAALEAFDNCPLLIIDSMATFLGRLNTSRNTAVHNFFAHLAEAAEKYNTAIVCITHLSKRTSGPALARVDGCRAFTAAARTIWLVAKDPACPRRSLLCPVKTTSASPVRRSPSPSAPPPQGPTSRSPFGIPSRSLKPPTNSSPSGRCQAPRCGSACNSTPAPSPRVYSDNSPPVTD